MYQQAITRGVSAKLNDCYLEYKQPELIDIGAARHQHDAYVATLQDLGLKVTVLPEDDDLPDCCFVEDSAVVTESFALITNMGTSERNGEREVVAEFLTRDLEGIRMQPPAQLEGGDVLRIGTQGLQHRRLRLLERAVRWTWLSHCWRTSSIPHHVPSCTGGVLL